MVASALRVGLRRLRVRLPAPDSGPHPSRDRPPPVGLVEVFSRRLVVGWVSVPADAPPTRVDLYLGGLRLTSTHATPDAAVSGPRASRTRGVGKSPRARSEEASADLVHKWQVPAVPGPADDRRNSGQQVRTFSFRVRGIWPYVRRKTRITVRVAGHRLPISGHGMYLSPPRGGRSSIEELRRLLGDGHLLSQRGRIQLSKQLDTTWQAEVMALYERAARVLRDQFGHDLFFIYGTLLGAVREGGYIGHDLDFDAAFVSRGRTGREAAAEMVDVAMALVAEGFVVDPHFSALHIHDPDIPDTRIDIFHIFFDAKGVLRFPFGVAGTTTFTEDDWQGVREIDFPGGRGLVPVAGEELVRHLYGDDWRQPKPGFNWNRDRVSAATSGGVAEAMRTKIYWASFYARSQYTTGSTFSEYVAAREDTPQVVIDIGCGDGRDSCAFGAGGRTVLGLDQSAIGIEHAQSSAQRLGLDETVSFRVCDVADVEDLGAALAEVVDHASGPTMFYLRFFLHAIAEDVQVALLDAIDAHARAGDMFAAEFRTDQDEQNAKVHTKHYRRFQSAAAFVADLAGRGWEVQHSEEGTGLSPYRDEDPVLCRAIARRT